jgi:hypothetical protein
MGAGELQQLQAIHVGHDYVCHQDVKRGVGKQLFCLPRLGHGGAGEPPLGEAVVNQLANVGFVVNDEHRGWRSYHKSTPLPDTRPRRSVDCSTKCSIGTAGAGV